MIKIIQKLFLSILILFITGSYLSSDVQDYDIFAKVESVRKGKAITLMFNDNPLYKKYYLIERNRPIGNITILDIEKFLDEGVIKYRVIANYAIDNGAFHSLIRAGLTVGLRSRKERETRDYSESKYVEKVKYKETIISKVDNRPMVLVPEGSFIFGSKSGQRDEFPAQKVELPAYYIDKFEVSNKDYWRFVKETNSTYPISWNGKKYASGKDEFPVRVSYFEAESYAKWANKRLPTEQEWEKAARGKGYEIIIGGRDRKKIDRIFYYPWGNTFSVNNANCREFWENTNTGKELKKLYNRGPLPVNSFSDIASPYGAVNMAGNVKEWTSSWYRAYTGNRYQNPRFGTLYKVLRGGGWYDDRQNIQGTTRHIGGIPNLYKDNSAGFRCVKDKTLLDMENAGN